VTKRTEPAEALQLGPQVLPELVQDRQIDDSKTIKVLSDPLRLRIMRALTEGADVQPRIWTVKQIAEDLGEPPSKLYWHMKQLLAVNLIQVAEIGLAGGIVEQRYRVAQIGFWIKVQVSSDQPDVARDALTLTRIGAEEYFDNLAVELEAGRAHFGSEQSLSFPPYVRSVGAIAENRLSQAKAAEFAERLYALVAEFNAYGYEADGVKVNLLTEFYATE